MSLPWGADNTDAQLSTVFDAMLIAIFILSSMGLVSLATRHRR